ncbi:hypothetical protein H4582DRAFT_1268464 [Lactarius indigo]|nr:hypothetical protein H4582DRAFT_1268464 [Lactarius indigo]
MCVCEGHIYYHVNGVCVAYPRPPVPTVAMKPIFRSSPKGKARDEQRGDFSRIPNDSDSPPYESHELAEDIAQDVTASGAQPGPSGHSESRSKKLKKAENLREQARKKGEEREELLEQAQKAREQGESILAKALTELAKMCRNAMYQLNRKAGKIIFGVMNWNAKPGEVNLRFLHVPGAIEAAKKKIQEAMSKGQRTIRFITGKGKRSKDGPKILPALREYITERGLESELDPDNGGVLIVRLPGQES